MIGELDLERLVAGGLGLARDEGGRVVLVEGALPGDRVSIKVQSEKPRLVRAVVEQIVRPSPFRITEPCPEVAKGCGGCDLQHAEQNSQVLMKLGIVVDSLNRIAKLRGVPVHAGPRLGGFGYRTSLRCGVSDLATGQLGFRHRHSNDIHGVSDCMTAHPLAAELVREARFSGAQEVAIRVSASAGRRLAIASGGDKRRFSTPDDVVVVDRRNHKHMASTHLHEEVLGKVFRVSAASFFQARPDGAAALVESVRRSLGAFDPESDRLVDLYGGVGLFTGALGAKNAQVVEQAASAVRDAKVNLRDLRTHIVKIDVEHWRPDPADVVVADPPRTGLGRQAVESIAATGARRIALVSCDPAAMARDARLLVDGGYELLGVEVIDMFPQTSHIEAVSTFGKRKR